MAKNNRSGSQIKHADIKYLAIRKRLKWSLSIELRIVNPLTKGIPLKKIERSFSANWTLSHVVDNHYFYFDKHLFSLFSFFIRIFVYFEKFHMTSNKHIVYLL